MSRKRKYQETNINPEIIFDALSSDFDTIYQELTDILRQKTKYKHLKRSGEGQFLNPVADSDTDVESQRARLCLAQMFFPRINLLAVEVDKNIDEIIAKKFDSEFHKKLKKKVLNVIVQLHYKESCPEAVKELLQENFDENSKDEEITVLKTLKGLSQYCAESLNNIKKQVIEMPIEEANPNSSKNVQDIFPFRIKEEPLDIDESNYGPNLDVDNFSVGSVSSVHTSELSSFDEDIVFSSDDEDEKKEKRMSLKAVEERLTELRSRKLDDQNQDESNKPDVLQSKHPLNESSAPRVILPQRIRKPNSKYVTDIISPLKKESVEKVVPSTESSTVKPKRGRPRKHI